MDALATLDQLAARMAGVMPPEERALAALVDASAAVRAFTGQDFTQAVSTQRMRVTAPSGRVRLAQRPVNEVTDVTNAEGEDVAAGWDGLDRVLMFPPVPELVDITYDHGYPVIPDDIVAVVCNIAARSLGAPPETAGIASTSITNFSESFGPVGASGPFGLFNDERISLARYKRVAGMVRLG